MHDVNMNNDVSRLHLQLDFMLLEASVLHVFGGGCRVAGAV